jgi:hypothetical protein
MEIAFGLPEVRAWATFSNDFNPIHFDLDHAKNAGLGGLVVHGMLALLPVKVAIAKVYAEHSAQRPASDWIKFHALFRSPIPHGAANDLTIRPAKEDGFDFRLHSRYEGRERFRGSLSRSEDLADWLQAHPLPSSSFSVLNSGDGARFADSYPEVKENWIALDAVVFSDFMRSRLAQIAEAVQQRMAALISGAPGVGMYVQSSHTVHINVQEVQSVGPLPFDREELQYGMGTPELVFNREKIFGSIALPVLHGSRLIMLIEIGLLARPSINLQ